MADGLLDFLYFVFVFAVFILVLPDLLLLLFGYEFLHFFAVFEMKVLFLELFVQLIQNLFFFLKLILCYLV